MLKSSTYRLNDNRRPFVLSGIFYNAATTLTTGVFLSGFLIFLNSTDYMIGLVVSSSVWAAVLSLFSPLLYDAVRHKKRLLIITNILYRLCFFLPLLLPALYGKGKAVVIATACLFIAGNGVNGFYNTFYYVWLVENVSEVGRNKFIYFRISCMRIANSVIAAFGGFLLSKLEGYMGYLAVFSLSFVLAIFDYRYEIVPMDKRSAYEAAFARSTGLSSLLGVFIGGKLLNVLPSLNLPGFRLNNFQVSYILSVFLMILLTVAFRFSNKKADRPS